MKYLINKLVVNRSTLTCKFKVAGSRLVEMATHYPFFDSDKIKERWGKFAYNGICEASKQGGQRHTPENVNKLISDIEQNGVQEPIEGWLINDAEFCEVFGGHHRAIIAHLLGYHQIDVTIKSFSIFDTINKEDLATIKNIYRNIYRTENLRKGQSYNTFPGLKSIRNSQHRLEKIYKEIIACSGDTLMDLGCNDGFFGANLSVHNFKPIFVDKSKAYLDVPKAEILALNKSATFVNLSIKEYLPHMPICAVTLYTDVFYHTVLEEGLDAAYEQLNGIIDHTSEVLIFSPGRWDKLEAKGCTQKYVYSLLRKKARQIRYLGKDNDKGYYREMYAIRF